MENPERKYYAVRAGYTPGIYDNWGQCKEQITGYSGAVFKAFASMQQAQAFIDAAPTAQAIDQNAPFAYIDGSYSPKAKQYGYGGFISIDGITHIVQGTGNNPDYLQYRNITGEVRGAMQVMKTAKNAGVKKLTLYYDYTGIECWIVGSWRCKDKLSQYYRAWVDANCKELQIVFVHVDGHTGNYGNEVADLIAKQAAGCVLTKKQIAMLEDFKTRTSSGNLLLNQLTAHS